MSVEVTPEALAKSAAKFRKDLLQVPIFALGTTLQYFTLRRGIRGSETVGTLTGDIELGPYNEDRVDTDKVGIAGRTLHNYLGSVVKKFSPNDVVESIYGADINQGDGLKNVDITLKVLSFLGSKLGRSLALNLFKAVRNDKGTKTVDLFDGFDTITTKEIASGTLATSIGNLYEFTEAIDSTNAVDMLVSFCRAASDELLECEDGEDSKGSGLLLYLPRAIVNAYRDDYLATTGHTPIYNKFNQNSILGFDNIKMVPMAAKRGSSFIQLSRRSNMLIGVNQKGDPKETIAVEKHHPFKLDFVSTLWFGTDYESIDPENLLVGKLAASAAPEPVTPGNDNDDEDEENGGE